MTENDLFEWLMQDSRILEADNIPHFMMGIFNCMRYMRNLELLDCNLACCKIYSDLVGDYAWIGFAYPKCMLEDDTSSFETLKRWMFDALEFKEKECLNERASDKRDAA